MAITKLTGSQTYRHAKLDDTKLKSTKDLQPIDEVFGQERAEQAIEFAMSLDNKGYNVYAIGPSGLGKRTMIERKLKQLGMDKCSSPDWVYVNDFSEPRKPKALELPHSKGKEFKKDLESAIKKIAKALPIAFDNETYFQRADKLKADITAVQQGELDKINTLAQEQGAMLTITPQGDYQFVAMNGEEPHTEESFEELTKEEKQYYNETLDALEVELRSISRHLSLIEEQFSERIQNLNKEVVTSVIDKPLKEVIKKYSGHKRIKEHIKAVEEDIYENFEMFLEKDSEQSEIATAALDDKFPRRYKVNVISTNENELKPIIVEENPNYHTLFGHIDTATFKGTVFTDCALIRPGSLHAANGGVLLLDAERVLQQPYVWDGLKRALRAKQISFTSLEKEVSLTGAVSLDPESIPLDVKIILFGNHHTYQLLQHYDPEFTDLFKVTADFEDEIERTEETEKKYAQLISSLCLSNKLLHCDKKAVARIIEHSSRLAGSQQKLSLHTVDVANLLRESNFMARSSKSNMIRLAHVNKALEQQLYRASRVQDSVMESFKNGSTLIDTDGSKVGQVNALCVLTTNDLAFGIPSKITATTAHGSGEIVAIERDVNLSGNIHSKGVMILSAYIKSLFSKSSALPIDTHITFEQSYGGIDGDSASMAEVCAIVSAYSDIPNRQDVAITGSMNQFGQAQPIGGVNEKIEGFFDACVIKGRTPDQGVIIPTSNVQNLMLRPDITEAIEKGEFTIWAVDHVTEAIEIFTGVVAEMKLLTGQFRHDCLYGIARTRLNDIGK
ncbi:Lon protease family protein [Vibrio barjaei]|uniref:Lon protease family protein n=1 Tax=Vibrio barjaei TaxID=1676683 RepID=UPI00228415AA|nr:ATP-binding protein [Vibrio barjaei]MCY9874503.1 ATP-binding protein [Vibrio barjaei]